MGVFLWARLYLTRLVPVAGTAADHHVHHRCFLFNYGHLFMYWDMMLGTYKAPSEVSSFNPEAVK